MHYFDPDQPTRETRYTDQDYNDLARASSGSSASSVVSKASRASRASEVQPRASSSASSWTPWVLGALLGTVAAIGYLVWYDEFHIDPSSRANYTVGYVLDEAVSMASTNARDGKSDAPPPARARNDDNLSDFATLS